MIKGNVVFDEIPEHPIYEQIRIEQKRVDLLGEQNKLLKQLVEQTNTALSKIKDAIIIKEDTPKWVGELLVKIQKTQETLTAVGMREIKVENIIEKENKPEKWEFKVIKNDYGYDITAMEK